jgi:hypothetical protein
MGLKPQNIVQAPQADFRRLETNKHGNRLRKGVKLEEFAFHRKHVRRAKGDVKALINLAIADPQLGETSGKKNTRLIYSDLPLLFEVLRGLSQ